MTRENFKNVVKAFSFWKINKRKGDYKLPNGEFLSSYLQELVANLLSRNDIAFLKNGNLGDVLNGSIFVPFGIDEEIVLEEQERRIRCFVREMIF